MEIQTDHLIPPEDSDLEFIHKKTEKAVFHEDDGDPSCGLTLRYSPQEHGKKSRETGDLSKN